MNNISWPADREEPEALQTSRVRIIVVPPVDAADDASHDLFSERRSEAYNYRCRNLADSESDRGYGYLKYILAADASNTTTLRLN
jgi:hypothetical protein